MVANLNGLHPIVRQATEELIKRCKARGIDILITQAYRSKEEQDALYAQGRTKPGKIVTNARAGESYHNYGLAIDFCLLENGKAVWEVNDKWMTVVAEAKKLGFAWGGDWKGGFKDYPHLEMTFGLSIADLKAGKRPPQPAQSTAPRQINKGGETEMNTKSAYELELEKAVEWAKKNGVSNGERLNEPATRAQVLLMLYRALGGDK